MIEIVTFTGVDSRTPLGGLQLLSSRYPSVEFGVLVGSHTGEADYGIFPPLSVVDALKHAGNQADMKTSIHLCGRYARAVMSRGGAGKELYDLCDGFGRVQVNLHGDALDPSQIRVNGERLSKFAEEVNCSSVILQHRGGWEDIPAIDHPKVEYLYDTSEGRGEESFANWPAPPGGTRVGYAGGLGPHNMHQAVDFAAQYPDAPMWFDMESRIRVGLYMDMEAVGRVCRIVWGDRDSQ